MKYINLDTILFQAFCLIILISPLVFFPLIQDASNLPKVSFIQFSVNFLLILWLVRQIKHAELIVFTGGMIRWGILWILWSGITLFWSIDKYSGFLLWIHWFYCGILFFLVINIITSEEKADTLFFTLVVSGSLISIIGCYQYVSGETLIPQTFAPASTFLNKNMAVQCVVMVWPLSLMVFILSDKWYRILYSIFAHCVMLLYIIYTQTRSAWVAVIFASVFSIPFWATCGRYKILFFKINKIKWILLGSSIFLVIFMSFLQTKSKPTSPSYQLNSNYFPKKAKPGNSSLLFKNVYAEDTSQKTTEEKETPHPAFNHLKPSLKDVLLSIPDYTSGSANIRIVLWKNTSQMIADDCLKGAGLGNWYVRYPLYHNSVVFDPLFSIERQPAHLHNDPLQILAETAVPGFLFYACTFIMIYGCIFKIRRKTQDTGTVIRLLFIGMCVACFLINSFFSFPLRMGIPPFYLAVIIGLLVCLGKKSLPASFKTIVVSEKHLYLFGVILCVLFLANSIFNFKRLAADRFYFKSAILNDIKHYEDSTKAGLMAIQLIPWKYKYWFELANSFEGIKDNRSAQAAYQKAITFHPHHINSLINLSRLYLKEGLLEKAEAGLLRIISILPDHTDTLFNLGLLKKKTDQPDEALYYLNRYIEEKPADAGAYVELGWIYLKKNQLKEASMFLERGVFLSPDNLHIRLALGIVYDKLNLWEKALAEYQTVLSSQPDHLEANVNLGLLMAKQRKFNKSVLYLKKALSINPSYGPAHMNLALAYFMMGDYAASMTHCKISQRLKIPQADILYKKLSGLANKN